jgi:hypothetical protein
MTCCNSGVVRFHEAAVSEVEAECEQETGSEELLTTAGPLLEHYIQSVRDSLGVELHTATVSR